MGERCGKQSQKSNKVTVFAIDGLDLSWIDLFGTDTFKQQDYGLVRRKCIAHSSLPLWVSFIAGEMPEYNGIVQGIEGGNKISKGYLRGRRVIKSETLFEEVENSIAVDVLGWNFSEELDKKQKQLADIMSEMMAGNHTHQQQFENTVIEMYNHTKEEFYEKINNDYDLFMVYYHLLDYYGHAYGRSTLRQKYNFMEKEFKDMLKEVGDGMILVVSDHGVNKWHTSFGFWSCNMELDVKYPKFCDFYDVILGCVKE